MDADLPFVQGRPERFGIKPDGSARTFEVQIRIDTPHEIEYYRSGGILPYVLRQIAGV